MILEYAFFYDPNTDPIYLTGVEQQQKQKQPQVETITDNDKDSLVECNDEIENNSIEADPEQTIHQFQVPG